MIYIEHNDIKATGRALGYRGSRLAVFREVVEGHVESGRMGRDYNPSQAAIAAATGASVSTVGRVLAELERDGTICREPHYRHDETAKEVHRMADHIFVLVDIVRAAVIGARKLLRRVVPMWAGGVAALERAAVEALNPSKSAVSVKLTEQRSNIPYSEMSSPSEPVLEPVLTSTPCRWSPAVLRLIGATGWSDGEHPKRGVG